MTPAAASASGREGEPNMDAAFLGSLVSTLGLSDWGVVPSEQRIADAEAKLARFRAAACREAVREATKPLVDALEKLFSAIHCDVDMGGKHFYRQQDPMRFSKRCAEAYEVLLTYRAHAARLEEMKGGKGK